jgi:hypothetical protein
MHVQVNATRLQMPMGEHGMQSQQLHHDMMLGS